MSEAPVESIRQVRQHLADVVERAASTTPTVITRRGQAVAAVVSLADYQRLRGKEGGSHRDWAARVAALPRISGEVDTLEVLRAARAERDTDLAQ